MAIATNLSRRPGSANWTVRIVVPADLRTAVGKREIWASTKTADPREARIRSAPIIHHWKARFDELRRKREPTGADLEAAVWRHYAGELEINRLRRVNMPTASDVDRATEQLVEDASAGNVAMGPNKAVADIGRVIEIVAMKDAAATDRKFREVREKTLIDHLARGETALVEWAVDEIILREGLAIERGSLIYRDLCQRLQRAELEALRRLRERDGGNWSGTPSDPIVKPPGASTAARTAAPGETIMELFDKFRREKRASVTEDTWRNNEIIVRRFAEFIGETAHSSAITRRSVRDWKQALLQWPRKASDCKEFAGLSFRKIIEANKTVQKPIVTEKTVNKYLAGIGGFCGWLLDNDYIEADVMSGQFLAIDKRAKKVLPYNAGQLVTIFASPLFGACEGDKRESEPGKTHVRDGRFWLPLIALFTGARLGEIAQLEVSDVRQDRGVWIFHITDEGGADKSVKTAGSARVVPIHPELVRIGLLEYREVMERRGEKRLFPELKRDQRGHFGSASKFWNAHIETLGVKGDRSLNFHSFRHTVADAFRRAGLLDEQFAMLLGHTGGTTTGRYGVLNEGELSHRKSVIERIAYPDLDLAKIKFAENRPKRK